MCLPSAIFHLPASNPHPFLLHSLPPQIPRIQVARAGFRCTDETLPCAGSGRTREVGEGVGEAVELCTSHPRIRSNTTRHTFNRDTHTPQERAHQRTDANTTTATAQMHVHPYCEQDAWDRSPSRLCVCACVCVCVRRRRPMQSHTLWMSCLPSPHSPALRAYNLTAPTEGGLHTDTRAHLEHIAAAKPAAHLTLDSVAASSSKVDELTSKSAPPLPKESESKRI
jgi:hypothetical protein